MHLRAHFLALDWAKRTTLVHINHQASQAEKYLRQDRHGPIPNDHRDQPHRANPSSMHLRAHSLALKWAQNGATLVRRNCQDYYYPRHGADADDDVINHLPASCFQYRLNHRQQHPALKHQNRAAESLLDYSPRDHPEGQKLHHFPRGLERMAQAKTQEKPEKPLAQDPVIAKIQEVHYHMETAAAPISCGPE